jgi:hypothetical protein
VRFAVGAWYRGLLDDAPVTFQVLEVSGSGAFICAKVFRTFYAGKLLSTEDCLRLERLADCREIAEPSAM